MNRELVYITKIQCMKCKGIFYIGEGGNSYSYYTEAGDRCFSNCYLCHNEWKIIDEEDFKHVGFRELKVIKLYKDKKIK